MEVRVSVVLGWTLANALERVWQRVEILPRGALCHALPSGVLRDGRRCAGTHALVRT